MHAVWLWHLDVQHDNMVTSENMIIGTEDSQTDNL